MKVVAHFINNVQRRRKNNNQQTHIEIDKHTLTNQRTDVLKSERNESKIYVYIQCEVKIENVADDHSLNTRCKRDGRRI